MRILYVCDKLITFILNEIIELKKTGNDVYILPERNDSWVSSHVIQPILIESGLIKQTYSEFIRCKNRKQKAIYFVGLILKDFFVHKLIAFRAFFYLLKIYPDLRIGINDYFDIRQLFGLKFDVIHSPFSTPPLIDKVYFISKIFKIPFTLSFRAHDIYEGDHFNEALKREPIIRVASKIITISEFNKKNIEPHINREIKIIHGSINPEYFKLDQNVVRSLKSIISVCRLHEQKGIIDLIKACHILNNNKVEYNCTLIGEGPEKKQCLKLIEDLDIPNITFVDYLAPDKIKKHLNSSTVFVLPCIISSSGQRDILANALKEAMAMELPVITSDICGIEELVDDGISGLLVPPKNPELLADAIEKIFAEKDRRKKMGKAGRKKIEKDFNVKKETRKLEDIFTEVLKS